VQLSNLSAVGICIFMRLTRCERVRVIPPADGYGAQFCIDVERTGESISTGIAIGIDVGLNHFYTDSNGDTVPNPRYLRKIEKALKRLQKRVSREKERF
jgi:putative transposase